MGDFYTQHLTIVKIPDLPEPPINMAEAIERVDPLEGLAALLNELDWKVDYDDFGRNQHTAASVRQVIEEGSQFTVSEGNYDELEKLATYLTENGGFSFWGMQEPKYEYMGTYVAHTPELGTFEGECDAEGNVIVPTYRLLEVMNTVDTIEELRAWVYDASGRAWIEAFGYVEALAA